MRIGWAWRLGLVLATSVLAASCGDDPASADPAREASTPAGLTIDPATLTRPWRGDLDGMVERRMVRVLVVPSRTIYFQDRGTPRGTSYDMFQVVERELNARLARDKRLKGVRVKFYFVPVRRDQLMQYLVEGRGDIAAANLTVTPERLKTVDFAKPWITGVREVLMTGPASPFVASVDDLSGKAVFVRRSSSYFESLTALNRRLEAAGREPVRLEEAPEPLEDEDLIEMLNAGLVPALVVDKHKADLWAQVFPRVKVRDDVTLREGGNVAWAVRKGSPQLKGFLDEITSTASGKLATERAVILARYLKSLTYVKDISSEAERRKFTALTEQFRKYGDRYDMDWLLMAAQGYQESGLDQGKRSARGAIGVMQVMPATGRELKVGDITQVEPNIHAGVKYMRTMIDRYFAKEPMTPLDRMLFAFAAYNMGPSRVAQLRKEAVRRGLDPNAWFGNVEYVAAEKVGQEPVAYVGNIYKYYVAYRLIQERHDERDRAREQVRATR